MLAFSTKKGITSSAPFSGSGNEERKIFCGHQMTNYRAGV